jgi:carboxyl-terminal processing protease
VSRASHAAAFAAGALSTLTVAALALPARVPADARFQVLDTFAEVIGHVERDYVDPVDEKDLIYDAIRGLLHNRDPYSTFLPRSRYQKLRQDTEGEYGTIGLSLSPGILDEDRPRVPPWPVVDDVTPGSPADVAGVQVDDAVVAVDGEPTAEIGHELKDAGAWEAKLRGASGTRVALSVVRVGVKEPRVLTLVRAQVKVPSVRHRRLEAGVGYLAITRFTEATSVDTQAALAALKQAGDLRALVLDLRNDPGGLVDQAVATADLFLDSGTIVTIRGRKGTVETHAAHQPGTWSGFPVIAIVDGGTASAAEIVAAALHDHKRATLVGLPTYGKGSVQTFFDLADGSGIKLTTNRYYTPNGNSLESKGIVPDVRVLAFAEEVITAGTGGNEGGSGATLPGSPGDDPQLDAALQLARKALRGP